MPAMAIDGAEITSRVLAERPRLFSAVEALRSALNLGADLLLPPVCISCRKRAGAHGLLCGDCWAGEPLFSANAKTKERHFLVPLRKGKPAAHASLLYK